MWTTAQKLFSSVVRMVSDLELHKYMNELLCIPDEVWATFAVGRLPVSQMGELTQILAAAKQMAREHWAWLLERQPPGQPLSPIAEVLRHEVRVLEEAPGPLDDHYIHFAAFDPTAEEIHISIESVKSVTGHLETAELSQFLGPVSVSDVVLWHEYFHVWSHVMRKTAARNAERTWRFKPRNRETLLHRTIEELAAAEFSKQAAGISFNPQLLQWLLIYTKDPRRALELARNVLWKSW